MPATQIIGKKWPWSGCPTNYCLALSDIAVTGGKEVFIFAGIFKKDFGRILKNLTPLGHCGICVGGQEEGGQQNGRKETQRPGQERDVCMLCLPVVIFQII